MRVHIRGKGASLFVVMQKDDPSTLQIRNTLKDVTVHPYQIDEDAPNDGRPAAHATGPATAPPRSIVHFTYVVYISGLH